MFITADGEKYSRKEINWVMTSGEKNIGAFLTGHGDPNHYI